MILGIDVSTYLEELEHGAVYRRGGVQIDPLDAFISNLNDMTDSDQINFSLFIEE